MKNVRLPAREVFWKLAPIDFHIAQNLNHLLEVHTARSIGIGVSVANGQKADIFAEIIAVKDVLNVRSKNPREEMGEGGFAG